MAIRVFLPGRGAVSLDAEQASVLNVTIPELGGLGQVTQSDIDGSAIPKSYSDERDVRFFDATVTYNTNDYVLFGNRIFFATADGVTIAPLTEAGAIATGWTELSRENVFLNIEGNTGSIMADMAADTLSIDGGTGITTTATDSNDTLTIDLSANIDDLGDVEFASPPSMNNVLQFNGTAWVPADVSGTGFSVLGADDGDDVSATSAINTIEVSGTGPVNTTVSSDTDSANLAISVDEATTSAPGLLSAAEKTLLIDIENGGYANDDLSIDTSGTTLRLREAGANINTTTLNNILSIGNLSDVSDTINPRTDQILQWDGTQWDAVTLEPGDYEFPTSAGSDAIRLEPGDYFIQNRIRYRYTGVTNSGIVTRSVAAEAVIPQNILNSTEFERVGLQTAYHTFPITLDTFVYRGDIVVHENVPYMFLGISTAGDGTVSDVDSLPVPANTTISAAQFAANFLTLSRTPRSYTIPSGNPDETVTIYRGDVIIQDNVPYMWLGVGGPATALVAEDSKVIQTNSRISANFLAEHYLTLNSDTTYTLETAQTTGQNVVSITLDDGDSETTSDSSFNLIGGENITLNRTDEGDVRISGVDVSTQHFPIYNSATLYELGDIIIYEFPMGSIQAADPTASPPIPPAPPVDAFLQVQFAGGSGAVPMGGRIAQEPIISGQTGINAVSRDWKVPANSISVFHPWLQYSVNSIVDYEGALYRSLTDVLRTSDGNPLDPPSAAGTADWTLLDVTDAAVINNTSIPELNGVSRQLWDRFNRVAIGYPVDSTMPTGVDNTADPVFVGEGANAENVRALIDAADITEPLRVWDSTTAYLANDQVLHDGGGNVFSIYVAEQDNTNVTPSLDNGTNWHLVRGGIVSVRGPDDIGPAGLSQNSTLSLQEGSGINVTRNGTTFTITARGSGHSDADDFGPGYMYNFASVRGGFDSGRVLATQATITVDNISGTGDDTLTLSAGTSRTFEPSTYYGIRLNGDDLRAILPNYPDVGTADIILYGISDPFGNDDLTVLQLDPPVASGNTIIGYANLPGTGAGRNPNRALTFLQLEPTHDTQHEPATWARENNTDDIPGNKLGSLDDAKPDNKADGTTLGTIDKTWIPADYVDAGTWNVTRATDPATAETIVVDNNGDIALTLQPHTNEVNELDDVNFDQTATGPQSLEWNTTNNEWELTPASSGRIVFSEVNDTTYDATAFITDTTDPTNTTRIRSAAFTNNLLRFNLVDASQLDSTIMFTGEGGNRERIAIYDWDEPAHPVVQDMVTVNEDPLQPTQHWTMLATSDDRDAGNFTITPASRSRDANWTVTYTNQPRPPAAPFGGANSGSTIPAVLFVASADGISNTATALGMEVVWRTATLNTPERNFGATLNFTQAYTSYNYTISTANVQNADSVFIDTADINSTNFPNGTTTISGVDVDSAANQNIGAAATAPVSVTDIVVENNDTTTLMDETIRVTFRRPMAVTGEAPVDGFITEMRMELPAFNYPIWQVNTLRSAAIPTATDFIAGTVIQNESNRVRDNLSNAVSGAVLNNLAGTENMYMYIAYPAGNTTPTSVSYDLVDTNSPNPTPTDNQFIPPANRLSSPLSIVGSGRTPESGEMYSWFRIEVSAGQQLTIRNIS